MYNNIIIIIFKWITHGLHRRKYILICKIKTTKNLKMFKNTASKFYVTHINWLKGNYYDPDDVSDIKPSCFRYKKERICENLKVIELGEVAPISITNVASISSSCGNLATLSLCLQNESQKSEKPVKIARY